MKKINSPLACWHIKTKWSILFSSGWLWGQILWQQTCNTSKNNPKTGLCNLDRLDKKEICWAHHLLGLQPAWDAHFHARICSMSTDRASTSPTMKATAPATSTCAANIWTKMTICQTGGQHPRLWQEWNKIHSKGNWNIFILCQGNGQHNAHIPQHDYKWACNAYQKDMQENQKVPGFCSDKSRCDYDVQSKQHDSCHP